MSLKIYQSSAGSGKTYTLVREYLRLILANPQYFRSTLAVTFTNDATGEMKERIVKALWQLSRNENKTLHNELQNALGNKINVAAQSAITLKYILHKYPDFSISTIDSFFLNITRALAREIGLPGRYDVDMNTDTAIDYIINRIFISIGENKELTSWLEEFAYSRMEDEKGWNIKMELKKIAAELFKDSFRDAHGSNKIEIDKSAISEIRKNIAVFENTIIAFGKKFWQIIQSLGLSYTDLYYGKQGFASAMAKLSRLELPKEYSFTKRFAEAIEKQNYFSKNAPADVQQNESLKTDITNLLIQTKNYYYENINNYLTDTASVKLIYLAGILNFMDEELKNYRHEKELLLISDVNKTLKDFIHTDETPFVYEKTGNTYRNFLMDEFQDTSAYQWKNFLPLLQNSLASGNHVLTVGDVKQSIYRWRGGDMKLLLKNVDEDLKMFLDKDSRVTLSTNYRSAKEIIDFNNTFFSGVANLLRIDNDNAENLINLAYLNENVVQQPSLNSSGYVHIEFAAANEIKEHDDEFVYPAHASAEKKYFLSKALHCINEQLLKGYSLTDMALLVRNNNEGNLLAEFLVMNGIKNINSRDSLLIQYAPQINFLISAVRFLANASDDVSKNNVNWFYSSCIDASNKDFNSVKNNVHSKVKEFFARRNYFLKLSLPETVSGIIAHFGLNTSPDAFIQRFEDLILEKTADDINTVSEFIEWWDNEIDRAKVSVQIPEGENSICIITIHRAKGLQFPIVIIPFTDWTLNPKGRIWVTTDVQPYKRLGVFPIEITSSLERTIFVKEFFREREQKILEEVNAMYVAFTRAEQKLFLFNKLTDTGNLSKAGNVIMELVTASESLGKLLTKTGSHFTSGANFSKPENNKSKTDFDPVSATSVPLTGYPIHSTTAHTGFKIKKYNSPDDAQQVAFGISLHQLLADFKSSNDKTRTMELLNEFPFDANEKEKLKSEATFAMETLTSNNWTSEHYEIKTECDISNGTEILRPDRIMIKNKKAIVVDYKTGIAKEFHQEQIRSYKNGLTEMGFTEVETWLLYSAENKLISVK